MATTTAYYDSPLGLIALTATEDALKTLFFVEAQTVEPTPSPLLAEAIAQLEAYFAGTLTVFSLPLAPDGTAFQQAVWQALLTVPHGQTASYLDIARRLDNEQAVRAVGAANGRNPLSVIIPCHRIIGSDGSLTGYGGGLWRKEWLLKHEGVALQPRLL